MEICAARGMRFFAAKHKGSSSMGVCSRHEPADPAGSVAGLPPEPERNAFKTQYLKLGDKLPIAPNFHLEKIKLQETSN